MKNLLLSILLSIPFIISSQNYAVQSVNIVTTNPDSCSPILIDATAFMGCINFNVGPGSYTVNGANITLRLNCTSSPICLGAVSNPVTNFSITGLNPGRYNVNAEAYLDNVMTNSIFGAVLNVAACGITSLNENKFNEYKLFPNPTSSKLFIEGGGALNQLIHFQLFDISGTEIKVDQNWEGSQMLFDLADLPSGIYFLRINEGEESSVHKILKK